MQDNLGYTKRLFILPFDHRASFAKMLGFDGKNLTQEQKTTIRLNKEIIYEAFKKSLSNGISKEEAAILVDEEYGDKIIQDAINQNYNIILTTEKSGQDLFDFEYKEKFGEHIEKYKPTFTKALIRYHQNANWDKLKILSDYCNQQGYKFLIEVLTPNKTANEAINAIKEFQNIGIEPDIWKLEGMNNETDYQNIVKQAQMNGRLSVGVVVLGRGADKQAVEQWISIGAKVKGVIGFAVGRTVFWEPLTQYKNGKITKEQTIEMISNKFIYFYNLFTFHTL